MKDKKRRVKKYLVRKFFIRFHMSIILLSTVLVGLISTKLLLAGNIDDVRMRYPLVVLISYLTFLLFIRIWLYYIQSRDKIIENTFDILDIPLNSTGYDSSISDIEPGCGGYGGAGASGSFDIPGEEIIEESASSIIDSADFLDEGATILVPLILVLSLIFGAGIFLIYEAPVILSEVAFEFLLAGILLKKTKEIDRPDWVGSTIRKTWLPFAATMIIAITFAFVFHSLYPGISAISEIFR